MANGFAQEYILTIDLGTSGPKVALVSLNGTVVDHATGATDILYVDGGGAEQDPAQWWQSICTTSQKLLNRHPERRSNIIALACTSQWSGTVAVGCDGLPLMNAIIWMDARGAPYVKKITKGNIRFEGYGVSKLWQWVRKTGGIPTHSGKDSIAHILYIKNCLPEIYEKTYQFLEPKDYLNYLLTGSFATSYEAMAVHWVTDNRDLNAVHYDKKLLKLAGIDAHKLPALRAATDILGPVKDDIAKALGIPSAIPVVMGTPDVHSAAIGSGAVEDYAGHLYVGTSSWLTCHVPFKKTDPLHNMASLPSALPDKYLVMNEQQTAGAALNFLRKQIVFPNHSNINHADDFDKLNELAASERPGSQQVIFTPWLYGERTPVEDSHVRAGFYNLSLNTSHSALVRSVFEGVAFNSKWLLKYVEKFIGRSMDRIHFIGGGARSAVWCQIHADILNREIVQIENPVVANSRGVALLAALGLGACTRDELKHKVQIKETYHPSLQHRKLYDGMFREFLTIYKQNKSMYARLNRLEGVV